MRFRVTLIVAGLVVAAGALSACGGGGTVPVPATSPVSIPSPTVGQATTIPATGGTASVTLPSGTLTATFPAGAFVAPTNVTLSAYSHLGAQLKPALASFALPSGAVFLQGFVIDTGTASMYQPVSVSVPLAAAVPSGDVVRVARYGTKGLGDVDTMTVTGTTATNDLNKAYVSVSNGGVVGAYVVYAVPAASAPTPAPITIAVAAAPSAAPQSIGTTATYTASGQDANGNPLAFTPTFSLGGVAATSAAGADPATIAVTAGTQGGSLAISAADTRTSVKGTGTFTIFTQRPSNAGNTFAFAGSMKRGDTYAYPANNPLPATNVTTNVTQSVAVAATANPYGAGTVQDFAVSETDAAPTQTFSSKGDYYYTLGAPVSGSSQFQLLGYTSKDDANNVTSVQYTAPTIVDELPETSGASWTNSPAQSVAQTFANGDTVARTVNADGSYTEVDHIYASAGTNYPGVLLSLNENSDGSGTVQIRRYENGSPFGYPPNSSVLENFDISAPGFSQFGIPQLTFQNNGYLDTNTPAPYVQYAPPSSIWYPTTSSNTIASIYTESDANNGSAAIPSACGVPASFGTTANELVQTVSAVDTVLGTLTKTTTTQWVVTGFGPVCVQVASDVQAYYNYNNDTTTFGPVYQSQAVLQETKIAETLTLQSTGTSTTAQIASKKAAALAPISPGAIGIAKAQLAQLVQRDRMARLHAFAAKLAKMQGVR